MQEERVPADLRIPKLSVPTPPAGDSGAVAEAAKLLVAAENPGHRRGPSRAHAGGLEAHGRARGGAASRRRRLAPAA